MDKKGFREKLISTMRGNEENIDAAISIAERFDIYFHKPGNELSTKTAWAFSEKLIAEGSNSEENYIALVRYCRFIKNDDMFVAFLELVDGGEVGKNLYHRMGDRFGTQIRDEIYAGAGIAPYGMPSPKKPGYLHPIIARLREKVGEELCREFLSASMRDLPDEYYMEEKRKFQSAGGIDAYLKQRKEDFVERLRTCMRQGTFFFLQEITEDVIRFVESEPEMGGGRREGNIIYETKIPYMTKQFLSETNESLRGYYYCHCPWAREAIKANNVKLESIFCNCSGGFHKKPWEVIFEQPLKVEILESILMGNDRCRFAIHLPENVE